MGLFVTKTKDAIYYEFESQASNMFSFIAKKALKKKMAKMFNDDFYLSINEHSYNNIPSGEFIKNSDTLGYCYLFALLLARDFKGAELKNGYLYALCSGEMYAPFEHAWVEFGDYCFDTTTRMVIKKDYYYKNYMAKVDKSYTSEQLQDDKLTFLLGLRAIALRENMSKFFVDNFWETYKSNKDDKEFVQKTQKLLQSFPSLSEGIEKALNDNQKEF